MFLFFLVSFFIIFFFFFFFSSRRRHTRFDCDWSSDVCSSDLDASKRKLSARALKVERRGNQLFPGPGFAFYQHRRIGRSSSADDGVDLPHLWVMSDDSEVLAVTERSLEVTILALDGFELQSAADQRRDLLWRERFFDVVERAELDSFDRDVERAVRRHDKIGRASCRERV